MRKRVYGANYLFLDEGGLLKKRALGLVWNMVDWSESLIVEEI